MRPAGVRGTRNVRRDTLRYTGTKTWVQGSRCSEQETHTHRPVGRQGPCGGLPLNTTRRKDHRRGQRPAGRVPGGRDGGEINSCPPRPPRPTRLCVGERARTAFFTTSHSPMASDKKGGKHVKRLAMGGTCKTHPCPPLPRRPPGDTEGKQIWTSDKPDPWDVCRALGSLSRTRRVSLVAGTYSRYTVCATPCCLSRSYPPGHPRACRCARSPSRAHGARPPLPSLPAHDGCRLRWDPGA